MIVALDVGGSSVKAGLVDRSEAVGTVTHTALDHTAPVGEIIDRLVAAAASLATTDRLALAIPEPFDYERGVSWMTHKFAALHGVAVADRLGEAVPHHPTVRCCNDAAAAVVGEAVAGAATQCSRVLGIMLGTGLGAAFVVDGRVVRDAAGIVVGDLYSRSLDDGRLADDVLSARGYVDIVGAGEMRPEEWGRLLGELLAPVGGALGAEMVVVGGGGTASFPEFGPSLAATLSVPIEVARLGRWAPLVGAAHICYG